MKTIDATAEIRFLFNHRQVQIQAPAGLLVLDYLRQRERATGTKEGCREGDCGACVVLIGALQKERVDYQPVTSCLMPLGELAGKHLVTIEGLNGPQLSPVQQAIVDTGATQCGFCTPGIVVSLTGLLMQKDVQLDPAQIRRALSGHLCRCTGYRSLKESGEHIRRKVGDSTGVDALVELGVLPAWFTEVPARLRALQQDQQRPAKANGQGIVIAGGTDLYVQRGDEIPLSTVQVLDLHPEMHGIRRQGGRLRLGALTTFEEFAANVHVRQRVPDIEAYMDLVASWQIRNRATLGGNIVNASPIGDQTILLLALEAEVVLCAGEECRIVPLAHFFRGYKVLDKTPDEILTEIRIPMADDATRVHFEKVSKRRCLDIATVNSAAQIRLEEQLIASATLAAGGVAPVPLLLRETSAFLRGKAITHAVAKEAMNVAQGEISPISDVRGSATYKRLLLRQQLAGHFLHLFPKTFAVEDFL
jgi:xanthine dehydrogenase small subunit